MGTFVSSISGQAFPDAERVSATVLRPDIVALIKEQHPDFSSQSLLSVSEANQFRFQYVERLLMQERGNLTELEEKVLKSVKEGEILVRNVDRKVVEKLSPSQRLADKIARFGGSWTFILSFLGFMGIWMGLNIFIFLSRPFDPYPFILLNLILSCLAALQAPVIMMSQNRQEEKDRQRATHDYQVNLKAELEIRMLHEKLDYLILRQQQKLFEIQEIQMSVMVEILDRLKSKTEKVNR